MQFHVELPQIGPGCEDIGSSTWHVVDGFAAGPEEP